MSAQEFAKKLTEYEEAFYKLKKDKEEFIEKYIADNQQYIKGQRVLFTEKNVSEKVYIESVGVHDDGEIFYRLNKSKADGTESAHRFYPKYNHQFTITKL